MNKNTKTYIILITSRATKVTSWFCGFQNFILVRNIVSLSLTNKKRKENKSVH